MLKTHGVNSGTRQRWNGPRSDGELWYEPLGAGLTIPRARRILRLPAGCARWYGGFQRIPRPHRSGLLLSLLQPEATDAATKSCEVFLKHKPYPLVSGAQSPFLLSSRSSVSPSWSSPGGPKISAFFGDALGSRGICARSFKSFIEFLVSAIISAI